MTEENAKEYLPQGIYREFRTTTDTVFGGNGADLARRQARCIEKYLDVMTALLMQKLGIDRDTAENMVLGFIRRLFASNAIHQPAWGMFRFWIGKGVVRFARKKLKGELTRRQKVEGFLEGVRDFVTDDMGGFELRQIRKSLQNGIFAECLGKGVGLGELTAEDVLVGKLEFCDGLSHAETAAQVEVSVSTVKRTMRKIVKYLQRHAREIRDILRDL